MDVKLDIKALCAYLNYLLLRNKLPQNLITQSDKIYESYSFVE